MVGGLRGRVLRFEFHPRRLSGFEAVVGRNLPFPTDIGIGLYNSLYYRTSRDSAIFWIPLRQTIVATPPRRLQLLDWQVVYPEYLTLCGLNDPGLAYDVTKAWLEICGPRPLPLKVTLCITSGVVLVSTTAPHSSRPLTGNQRRGFRVPGLFTVLFVQYCDDLRM